jgi:uncharacterized protein involved in exopolysaccharide biosynthesis
MNEHFEDARYYLRRAASTARKGVRKELASLERRLDDLIGDEDPDRSRVEALRSDLRELQERTEGEARDAIGSARNRLARYRPRRPAK